MQIEIRKAGEEDFPAVLEMIMELATFEKAPEKMTNTVAQMKEEKHLFQCYVAEKGDGEIVGMMLYFFAYFTWVGKSLYLDDLYVKDEFRGHKIGTKLLDRIFEIAREENCKRVRWQVLDWNTPAIEMYRKCGATLDNEWVNCDFDSKGILEYKLM